MLWCKCTTVLFSGLSLLLHKELVLLEFFAYGLKLAGTPAGSVLLLRTTPPCVVVSVACASVRQDLTVLTRRRVGRSIVAYS